MAWRRVGRIRCDADDERPATVLGLRCVYRVGLPLAQRQRNVIAIAFDLGDLGNVCSSCRLPRQAYQWRSQVPLGAVLQPLLGARSALADRTTDLLFRSDIVRRECQARLSW